MLRKARSRAIPTSKKIVNALEKENYQSISDLTRRTRLSVGQVFKAVVDLEKKGLAKSMRGEGKDRVVFLAEAKEGEEKEPVGLPINLLLGKEVRLEEFEPEVLQTKGKTPEEISAELFKKKGIRLTPPMVKARMGSSKIKLGAATFEEARKMFEELKAQRVSA